MGMVLADPGACAEGLDGGAVDAGRPRLVEDMLVQRMHQVEQAAAIRLRPVLMTTAAMVLGVIPLILATGAGAVSRFDIGIVIATGMSVGTLFTLFVLPCIYTLVARPDAPPGVTQAANAH